jgi:hypothetical protein
MSRANRHFRPGHVWCITHRCRADRIGPPFKSSRLVKAVNGLKLLGG